MSLAQVRLEWTYISHWTASSMTWQKTWEFFRFLFDTVEKNTQRNRICRCIDVNVQQTLCLKNVNSVIAKMKIHSYVASEIFLFESFFWFFAHLEENATTRILLLYTMQGELHKKSQKWHKTKESSAGNQEKKAKHRWELWIVSFLIL